MGTTSTTRMTHVRARMLPALLAAALLVLLSAAGTATAREGVYVGIGAASQTLKGDLVGHGPLSDPANGNLHYVGEPDPATGLILLGGYGINPYLGVDLAYISSDHAVTYPGGPANAPDATLRSTLIGVRLIAPVSDMLEIFGRLGWGGYRLTYHGNVYDASGTVPKGGSQLTGSGGHYGFGAEVSLGTVGLELGSFYQDVRFDRVHADAGSFNPSTKLSVPITTYTLLVTYHFR